MPAVKKTPARTAKKPVPAKSKSTKAPAKKAATAAPPAKRPVGRPRKVQEAPVVKPTSTRKPAAKKASPAKEAPSQTTKKQNPRQKVNGLTLSEISELTGFAMGTQNFIVAVELIRGGRDRKEILDRVRDILPDVTRNGTPKIISNIVGIVINKLTDRGFVIQGNWSMVKP